MRNIWTVYKRELLAFFNSPVAYVIIIAFLLLSGAFTFGFGFLLEAGDASLAESFFVWHPWFFVVLAPAVGMRQWADENRLGTIELLLTMPVKPWQAILGKYLASCTVWAVALALTFPIWWTVNYLGDPDNGTIIAGYLGSFLVCATCLAITTAVSASTRNQVVCLIVSVVICLGLAVVGFEPIVRLLSKSLEPDTVSFVTAFGFFTHFVDITRGVLVLRDVAYFLSIIVASLVATSAILRAGRA
jgi:ABC-2 type transport system permease protein